MGALKYVLAQLPIRPVSRDKDRSVTVAFENAGQSFADALPIGQDQPALDPTLIVAATVMLLDPVAPVTRRSRLPAIASCSTARSLMPRYSIAVSHGCSH